MSRKKKRLKKLLLKKQYEKLRVQKKKKQQRLSVFFIYGFKGRRWYSITYESSKNKALEYVRDFIDKYEYFVISNQNGQILYKIRGKYEKEKIEYICKFDIEPVEGVKNQYTVKAGNYCTQEDVAALISQQLQNNATIFRFWFTLPISPDYPEGKGSTGFEDLPRMNINTLKRVKQFLARLPGPVFQWFYFVGKL